MPAFAYTALDPAGKTVKGLVSVRNKLEVYRELEKKSLSPVSVKEEVGAAKAAKKAAAAADGDSGGPAPRLKRATLIMFTSELADLLDAGMQLEQALRILHERQEDKTIRRVSARLRDDIREGAKFSSALKKASPSFDDLYTNLVAAGEASGSLAEILRRLALNLQVMADLRSRVVGALVYPAFLVGLSGVLIVVLGTVVLPRLTALFKQSKTELPLLTKMLVFVSEVLTHWWWVGAIVGLAAMLTFRVVISSKRGREWWDRYKLHVPLFGAVISSQFYAQFCQSLGNLVNNGVPLLTGLKLMGRATPNVFLRDKLAKVIVLVAEGAALSTAMRKVGEFPAVLMDLLAVGEHTGHLAKSLQKGATRYDKELTKRIDRLTKMIPPVILIIIGVIVMVVAYAIINTLFQSISSIRGRA